MKPNTEFNAQIVVQPTIGGYNIWHNDTVIGSMTDAGRKYIIAGAVTQQCSVYDMELGRFIAGTIDELMRYADKEQVA